MRSIHDPRGGAALPPPLSMYHPAVGRRALAPRVRAGARLALPVLTLAVALAVSCSVCASGAGAAEPPFAPPESVTLVVGDAAGAPGDTVAITVGFTTVIGVDSLAVVKLCLTMDPTMLTPVSAARAAQLAAVPDDGFNPTFGEGSVCLSAASPTPLPIGPGALFIVRAVVGPLVRAGDATSIDIVDEPGNLVLLLRTVDEAGVGVKHLDDGGQFVASGGVSCTQGDANGDGQVNSGDAVLALRIAVQLIGSPSIDMLCGADANRDRRVNSGDAVWILRRTVGLPKGVVAQSGPGAPTAPVRATLSTVGGAALLLLEGAEGVHGLDLDMGFDAATLQLGPLSGAGRSVAHGLYVEHEPARGLRGLRWADAQPLGGGAVIRLMLPIAALTAPGAAVSIDRLELFDANGATLPLQWQSEASAWVASEAAPDAPSAGTRTRLLASAPNPFNPSTTVRFTVPRAGHVLLQIHDASGARVATLVDEVRAAGQFQVPWSGVDSAGRPVASGVYFARMRAEQADDVLRLVLVK